MRSVFASCAAITSTLSAALTFRRNFFVAVPVATLLVASFQSPTFTNRSLPFSTSVIAMSAVFDESSNSGNQDLKHKDVVDPDYPGTAVTRMLNIRERVRSLSTETLSGEWEEVRRQILWAGGLKDIRNAPPGMGYTGHSFNDFNHVDLTAMLDSEADNENEGRVAGIAFSNRLGPGVRIATDPTLGPGGSWSTCAIGSNKEPPQDVAHLQFRARIAFKLVWIPPSFERFVLVDDNGDLLAQGAPTGRLPHISERAQNYRIVSGSKYARVADNLAAGRSPPEPATDSPRSAM